jgi:uncharacterized membrane protein
MILLAFFVFVFAIVHLNPAIPSWKAHAVQTFGKAYGPAYGIISLFLLVACLWAFRQAEVVTLYDPPSWGRLANFALSLIGFLFIGIFLFRGSWRNLIKVPMATGIGLWALGHLLANGDTRTVMLFGGLAGVAILQGVLKLQGSGFTPSEERAGHNLLSLLGGLALYGLAAQLHSVIAGVPLIVLQ